MANLIKDKENKRMEFTNENWYGTAGICINDQGKILNEIKQLTLLFDGTARLN